MTVSIFSNQIYRFGQVVVKFKTGDIGNLVIVTVLHRPNFLLRVGICGHITHRHHQVRHHHLAVARAKAHDRVAQHADARDVEVFHLLAVHAAVLAADRQPDGVGCATDYALCHTVRVTLCLCMCLHLKLILWTYISF